MLSKKLQKLFSFIMLITMCFSMSGCGQQEIDADLSLFQSDVSAFKVPDDTLVVGLGEASHGVAEYHQMKMQIFQALVQNNGCHTFIIEGDFGGSLIVDEYIHGAGNMDAKTALSEIGFSIYQTEELSSLVEWMRDYNETAPQGKDLHFYGMDMQVVGNNILYCLNVLQEAESDSYTECRDVLAPYTDDTIDALDATGLQEMSDAAASVKIQMDKDADHIIGVVGQERYDLAYECINSVEGCAKILGSGNRYNEVRDAEMAKKVDWFLAHGDGSVLFINGHNGHIAEKSSVSYQCLGANLSEKYQKAYYAIGTDALHTEFNSKTDNGFEVQSVTNKNLMNGLLTDSEQPYYIVQFDQVASDEAWQQIISKKQRFTSLNVGLQSWQTKVPYFYTLKIVPADNFDAMIVYQQVHPTTLYK